jgi:hypothetical protein
LSLFVDESILIAQSFGNHHLSPCSFDWKRSNLPNENAIQVVDQNQSNMIFDLSLIWEKDRELLDVETLSDSLSNELLRIESEDWRLEFTISLGMN